MGSLSIWHWLIVLAVVLLLFGGSSKVSNLMGDFAKGIKSFKKNMAEEPDASMEASAADRPAGTIAAPGATNPPAPVPPQVVGQPTATAYQPHAAQVPYPSTAQASAPGSVRNPG